MNATHQQRQQAEHRTGRLGGRLALRGVMQRPPLTLGRLNGIELRVHVVWLVGAPLVGLLAASGQGSLQSAIAYFLLPVVWALSVLAHEAGHAVTASRLGHRVDSVSLLPMGGATAYDGPPSRARDQVLISGAGPAVSLLLATGPLLIGLLAAGGAKEWWLEFGAFNAAIFVLNTLPALPLDGGRVVHAALRQLDCEELARTRIARFVANVTAFVLAAAAGGVLATGPLAATVSVTVALSLYAVGLMIIQLNVVARASPALAASQVRNDRPATSAARPS